MAKKKPQLSGWDILRTTWRIISIGISVLMFLFFAMIFLSIATAFVPAESLEQGNIAVIPLNGMIVSGKQQGLIPGVASQEIIKLIEKAEENKDIKGIIIEINSPGGTPVATDELATKVKTTNKTTLSVIRESGTSGAYWVASAADKVYANRMSMTGSIGVQASQLEFTDFIEHYNVSYRRLVAGKHKDAGSVFRPLTTEEEQLYRTLLDDLHTEFIRGVADNRNLPEERVRELATGFPKLGREALELGLVDELGGKEDALDYFEETLNITAEPVTYKKRGTFLESLSEVKTDIFYWLGQGIGTTVSAHPTASFT